MSQSPASFSMSPHFLMHLERLRGLSLPSPQLNNVWKSDEALQSYTAHIIGNNTEFQQHLTLMGDKLATEYVVHAQDAEENPPQLEQFDPYGKRIDRLKLSEGWKTLGKLSARDGIVSLSYETDDQYKLGKWLRYGQLVQLAMYQSSSGLYGCPLAMTDGAAYVLRGVLGKVTSRRTYLQTAYSHLTSRTDPWTSGQWMTQKKGGSDVSNTETCAVQDNKEMYRLYGYKWFSSATDSHIALALAKIIPHGVDPTQQTLKSVKPSLFYVPIKQSVLNDPNETTTNGLNQIEIVRLKNKLGTHQLPTAQLLLKGSKGFLIGEQGQGVKNISKMLTVTRLYNAASAISSMQRTIALSRSYATVRKVGSKYLHEMPLQQRVLSSMQVCYRGNLMFYLKVAELFSLEHNGVINRDQANILRLLTPLLKLYTAKHALRVVSEGVQCLGGQGYIEGTQLPTIQRDTQVLSIWQGTTNILCLDFLRALNPSNGIEPLKSLRGSFESAFDLIAVADPKGRQQVACLGVIVKGFNELFGELDKMRDLLISTMGGNVRNSGKASNEWQQFIPTLPSICNSLCYLYISVQLYTHALASNREMDAQICKRWLLEYSPQQNGSPQLTINHKLNRSIGIGANSYGPQKQGRAGKL